VLITDSNARGVLAAARTLAYAGFRVGVVSAMWPAATHWSRAPNGRHFAPDPRSEPQEFVRMLARIATAGAYEALIPGSDAALGAISEHRDLLPPALRVGLPPAAVVAGALDKRRFAELAEAGGLLQPRSESCKTVEDALLAADRLGYPVLLKPSSTVFRTGRGLRQLSSRLVRNEAELARMAPDYGSPFLIQERLTGRTYSLGGVLTDGRLAGAALAVYERTWPPLAGNAAFATSVPPPPDLLAEAQSLLGHLGWQGMFEIEYVADGQGRFVPIDLNPRPYGSLALASAAGAPLAVVWTRTLFGEHPRPAMGREGFRYRWEDADLRALLWTLRREGLGALRALRPRRRTVHAYFRLSDPAPLVARALELSVMALKRRAPGGAPRRRRPRADWGSR
jgi:predicted ATP-grasp superfamily ATP-dependent carboligase